jgi:hypothetical protein
VPSSNRDSFSQNAYLLLTLLIQAAVFSVFVYSLSVLQWHALNRWPFLVTELLMLVIVTFGHVAVARDLAWHVDLLDVLLPFLIGLLQCVPMLLLESVPKDAMWWFVCYLGLANVSFANLIVVRMKTPHTIALPLVRRRTILIFAHSYLLVLAIVACYYEWHVELVGVLFMVEHLGIVAGLYWLDLRTRHDSMPSN